MSLLTAEQYLQTLKDNGITAVSPCELGSDYNECSKEWYHVTAYETDLPLLASNQNIKWYAVCRCREYVHGLIHFTNGMGLATYRNILKKIRRRLHPRTVFRKIICLDHAVTILHFICCDDGAHYDEKVFNDKWIHKRGEQCTDVRDQIASSVARELHDFDTCRCARGGMGIKIKAEANEKRRRFYRSERGMQATLNLRNKYKARREEKIKLIKLLMENNTGIVQRETVEKLINVL